MVKSNQRITKIKRDPIEELLKKAETTDVEDACQIQPQGMDLTPYPDMSSLRLWVRDYLLKGLNVIYNNELSIDGQTYLTTIVDGLPLFTKLSKTIKQETINPPPITDFKSYQYYYGYYSGSPTVNNIGNTINIPAGLHVKTPKGDLTLSSKITYTYDFSTNRYILLYNSNDYWNCYQLIFSDTQPTNSTGEQIAWFNTSSNDWNIISSSNNLTSLSNDYATPIALVIQQSSTVTSIETNQFIIKAPPVKTNVETSKPGLWLSNLCEPYQVSQAGGWLRQNLINDYYKEYTNLNSDTIGNYSFSYFQRGIIHRDAGSTHADNDSYCQHWSPSALGCISHDSLIIPTNNLRNTYTSYQTLAVPSDVDKQSYSETISKDVEFTFVDNNNNIPLSTTTFNGRVVGDGWQYEFVFEPNYGGSGNNYGETEEDVPNGSNGGCVTGQITYLLDNGDVCVQSIDKCFVTDQALFNPYNHSTGDALNDKGEYIQHKDWSGRCSRYIKIYDGTEIVLGATTTISNCCGSAKISLSYNTGDSYSGSECTVGYGSGSSTVRGDSTVAEVATSSVVEVQNSDCCNYYGGQATLYFKEALEPQTNITIYLNIWDLQKEYAAQGLPWAYTCEYDRFRVEISTQPCSDWYCKSFVIAENVDINDLGDISALQRVVFSGG